MTAGQKAAIGTVLIEIETEAGAGSSAAAPASNPPVAAKPATATPASAAATTKPLSAAPAAVATSAPVPLEFKLPEVSEGVKKVDVAAVHVKVGDVISAGTNVCDVETDKAVAEIACPHAGTVQAVHITPGVSIPIGAPLITILTTTGTATSAKSTGPAPSSVSAPSTPATAAATTTSAPEKKAPVSGTAVAPHVAKHHDSRPPAPAGPASRRLARKLGVDLYQVKGSAAGGRITIEDIEAYVRERMAQPAIPSAASAPGFGIVTAAPLPDFAKFGPVEKQPMNKIFRTAAANLHAAWVTIPHVTQHDLADITELETARKKYVKANPNAPKITMTAIMIKAVVGALKAFPQFNSSVDMQNSEIVLKQYYHIGVAVDTPNGLVVPVIRNCDQKNVLQVAAELTELAGKARDRKLKTEDMQGGTFTITNLGGIGGTAFTPIVNYPEVAILGMSRGINQLVMEEGQVTERLMLPLSLSYDHRAVNGADAARFIVKLSSSLSNFFELF
ncbi:MAG: 2-oxo acid dehydrogenase subunit E2 [Planctomyces sp.]|nr:2-oxo acid dehydrogenase subunit E2 [Planctomyces sp.]